ncbi:MAG: NAD-dependent epimerase/dehydratase family protein [Fibromonadales bacterium]|nr:NAD-dependent epimerase/dehydratase family protein [Fibromonadales bacterium]
MTDFENKTFFITGATGLLGSALIKHLQEKNRIIAWTREKGDIREKISIDEPIDYIVHGANPTASKYFVDYPVETIRIIYEGTLNTLELAREKNVKGYLYLSSLEVYTNITGVRNCYPEGKRLAECLCTSYFHEYGVNAKIARLAQVFGPGIDLENDNRVIAQFMRCARDKKDIVLRTKGDTVRNYCHITDAVSAMLCILAKGKGGEFYDIASKNTEISVCDLAKQFGNVVFDIAEDTEKLGYLPTVRIVLDTAKLESLGWKPGANLKW